MKLKITEVTKYEYNGNLYDTKEEIQEVFEEKQINDLYKIINNINYDTCYVDKPLDIIKVIAKIPDTTLALLRKRFNKIEKESN